VKKFSGILFALVLVVSLTLVPACADNGGTLASAPADTDSDACTNILVGNAATVDGSAISSYCCDGARYAQVKVIPGGTYKPGTMIPIYYAPPVYNYETYLDYVEYLEDPTIIGEIPQAEETYSFVNVRVWYYEDMVGGVNEYGLTIGETTIGGRRELRNSNGLLYIYFSGLKEQRNALMTLGLQRAKTAREAIEVMGTLAETYGYIQTGEHVTVNDGNEVWAFEIFGPGAAWTPGCGDLGAVWCAQRIPDGEVGVSANRSRIGEVPLVENEYFMFSDNTRSLAYDMGWWDGTEPFVWHDAYGPRTSRNLREWEALNWFAPSLGLDPDDIHQPFSVVPDNPVTVQDVMALHRDYYQGTPFDVTEDPAWLVGGVKSPMTCPWGPRDLHKLIGVSAPRSIGTPSSAFSFVAQVNADLPDPIRSCFWFGFCPAATTCYVPIYSGVTELPESWTHTTLNEVDREDAWWAFHLVDHLALIKYQSTIEDIEGVRDPAEAAFFAQQSDMEGAVLDLYASNRSEVAARELGTKLVTKYTNACMNAASDGYWDLVDYMHFKYYSRVGSGAPQELPVIDCPPVPTNPGKGG